MRQKTLRHFCGLLLSIGLLHSVVSLADPLEAIESTYRQINDLGKDEVYLPAYTVHGAWAYSYERRKELNAYPLGAGFGRGISNDKGDWKGIYAMGFMDSHHNLQPVIGYGQSWNILGDNVNHINLGYTAFVTARQDIASYTPLPGVLPVISGTVDKSYTLAGTFIPVANVFFFWGRATFQ